MTRHQDHGGVALCTGNAPAKGSTLTKFWESVTCRRCRSRVKAALGKLGRKDVTREVIAAAKSVRR